MLNRLHKLLIVSAIIPATILFLFDIWGLFVLFLDGFIFNELGLILGVLFGFLGYFGFWKLIFFGLENKIGLSIILLISGILSCFLVLDAITLIVLYLFESTNIGLIIFLWPNLVAIFYLIFLSKKLILEKRKA